MDLEASPKQHRGPIRERILDKSVPEPNTGCWIWLGHTDASGYGRLNARGHHALAHRASYETFVGKIPDGLQIDHKCRQRCCVNPEHLEPVTQLENTIRSTNFIAEHARKSECVHGHEFSEENTYITPAGARACRRCCRDRYAKWYARHGKRAG